MQQEIVSIPKPTERRVDTFNVSPKTPANPELLNLPIYKSKNEIAQILKNNESLIIVAGTGTGKTTGLPIMAREILGDVDIVVTQPRKAAADGVATRVAKLTNSYGVGNLVGLRHKGKNLTSEATRILFEVEGSLLNELKEDPMLANHDIAIVDEVHERGSNTDLILALLKRAQNLRRTYGFKPLKIIATSATLDAEKLKGYLGDAPIYNIESKSPFPVSHIWSSKEYSDGEMPTQAASVVTKNILTNGKAVNVNEGDILIFMPGKSEIEETKNAILSKLKEGHIDESQIEIIPFDATTSEATKRYLEKKTGDKRRIIVATNVAETSVTIPSLSYVIDSGLIKQTAIDPQTGIEILEPYQHSQSGVLQRAGRGGRTNPCECWHLYTEENFRKRSVYQIPEIQRTDLTAAVLTLKNIGIDIDKFEFIDRPNQRELDNAVKSLQILDALDENGNITEVGKEMVDIPIDPHLSRMLVEGRKENCLEEAATVASVYQYWNELFTSDSADQVNIFLSPIRDGASDFITMRNLWKTYQKNKDNPDWIGNRFLNQSTLKKIEDLRQDLADQPESMLSEKEKMERLGKCITAGFADKLLEESGRSEYAWLLHPHISNIFISNRSTLFRKDAQFVIAGSINKNKKIDRIFAEHNHAVKPGEGYFGKIREKIRSIVMKPAEKSPEKKTSETDTAPASQTKHKIPPSAKTGGKEAQQAPKKEKEEVKPKENPLVRIFRNIKKFLGRLNPLNLIRWLLSIFKRK